MNIVACRARSKNFATGWINLKQGSSGFSHRQLRSRTNSAVVFGSTVTSWGMGLFGILFYLQLVNEKNSRFKQSQRCMRCHVILWGQILSTRRFSSLDGQCSGGVVKFPVTP